MDRMLALVIALGVVALLHLINAAIFVGVWVGNLLVQSDKKIAMYIMLLNAVTAGVIGWAIIELWSLMST